MFERHLDDETGIISIAASGKLSVAEVDLNCAELRDMISSIRHDGRPVRLLFDFANLPPQGEKLERYIVCNISKSLASDDRCVLIAKSEWDKKHFRNIVKSRQITVSATRLPAEMWLLYEKSVGPRDP